MQPPRNWEAEYFWKHDVLQVPRRHDKELPVGREEDETGDEED